MELSIRQIIREQEQEALKGGWHTELSLKAKGWTTSMIANAKAWAEARGLSRKNEVHGEDEWRVPTEETFDFSTTRSKEGEGSGSTMVDDPKGTLLDFSKFSAQAAMTRGSAGSGACNQIAAQSAAAAKLQNLPMVQQTQDPFGYITSFVDQMGKKMDRIDEQKDTLSFLHAEPIWSC
ncbi:unnamed protein product [Durusdinium trenchii]|uniref:DUF1566 domain-containing protein n=1 Tax=Durusdinium trenchii TaxID=1381693 RepID=A0ABP0SM51_9DINO